MIQDTLSSRSTVFLANGNFSPWAMFEPWVASLEAERDQIPVSLAFPCRFALLGEAGKRFGLNKFPSQKGRFGERFRWCDPHFS
ncbi:MAG: hypothetical protein BWY17_02315 [Deltaproteobacteria bacterium ADurb.Bin207]|jgi:hypothetical protein|nr:MAG: hypothetical protein BWY17_02315 [Deltaproteobacteria bacterium ADurb.Bin207]